MISVIIPVYNASKFLSKTLDSVINQTLPSDEIIIIDDGSTDNSLDIIEKFKNKHATVKVYTQKNSGPSVTRNRGVEYANYEWVCFVDADDLLHPQRLEIAMNFSNNCDAVICDFKRFRDKEDIVVENYDKNSIESLGIEESNLSVLLWGYGLPRMLMKKSVYELVGGLDTDLIHNEDHELHFRMLIEGAKFKKINIPLYYYRQHKGESRLSNQKSKHFNIFKALYKMEGLIDSLPTDLRIYAKEQIANRIAHNALKSILLGGEDLKKHIKFAKKMNPKIQPYNNLFFNTFSSVLGYGNLERVISKLKR